MNRKLAKLIALKHSYLLKYLKQKRNKICFKNKKFSFIHLLILWITSVWFNSEWKSLHSLDSFFSPLSKVNLLSLLVTQNSFYSLIKWQTILTLIQFILGGSALLSSPVSPLSLDEKVQVTKLVASKGASIEELNAVRKSISSVKGGKLSQISYPAEVFY